MSACQRFFSKLPVKDIFSLTLGGMGILLASRESTELVSKTLQPDLKKYISLWIRGGPKGWDRRLRVPFAQTFMDGIAGELWAMRVLEFSKSSPFFLSRTESKELRGSIVSFESKVLRAWNRYLDELKTRNSNEFPVEYFHGIAGQGSYALQMLSVQSQGSKEIVSKVLALLEKKIAGSKSSLWVNACAPPHVRSGSILSHLNLGVAHGNPGIIGFLSNACQLTSGTDKQRARRLLAASSTDLLEIGERFAESGYPCWVSQNACSPSTNVAWCYGNPGIALTLNLAADALGERFLRVKAGEILRRAVSPSSIPRISTKVKNRVRSRREPDEPGLCHGSAGVALILQKFGKEFRSTDFKNEARRHVTQVRSALNSRSKNLSLLQGEAGARLCVETIGRFPKDLGGLFFLNSVEPLAAPNR